MPRCWKSITNILWYACDVYVTDALLRHKRHACHKVVTAAPPRSCPMPQDVLRRKVLKNQMTFHKNNDKAKVSLKKVQVVGTHQLYLIGQNVYNCTRPDWLGCRAQALTQATRVVISKHWHSRMNHL